MGLFVVKVIDHSTKEVRWEKTTAATAARAITNIRFRLEGRCKGMNDYAAITYPEYLALVKRLQRKQPVVPKPKKKQIIVQLELF